MRSQNFEPGTQEFKKRMGSLSGTRSAVRRASGFCTTKFWSFEASFEMKSVANHMISESETPTAQCSMHKRAAVAHTCCSQGRLAISMVPRLFTTLIPGIVFSNCIFCFAEFVGKDELICKQNPIQVKLGVRAISRL